MSKVEVIKRPVEQIGNNLKQNAWMAVLESLATIILGVLLVAWPDVAIKAISYVVGVFFAIKGAYQIINYFLAKGHKDFFNNDLLSGTTSILVGITVLIMGEEIANVFRIVIGIWIIYESLVRMNTAIKLHAAKITVWKYVLILALMMLVLGVFVTFYSGAVITLVGWMMILVGVFGIVGDVMFIQYVNKISEAITAKLKVEKK